MKLVPAAPGRTCGVCHAPATVFDMHPTRDVGYYCDAHRPDHSPPLWAFSHDAIDAALVDLEAVVLRALMSAQPRATYEQRAHEVTNTLAQVFDWKRKESL